MQLYFHPLSTYSQKVLIALYEKNVAFESTIVQLMDPAEKAKYEAIYPMGKVPMLQAAADHMIPESSIIIEFLEGHCLGGTRLIPEGVDASRKVRFMDRMCDLYLNDAVGTLFFGGMKPEGQRNSEAMAKAAKHLQISYTWLNKALQDRNWLAGEHFSMADCAAIPALFYAQNIAPFSAHPNLVRYWEQAQKRSSVQRVFAEAKPHLEAFQQQMMVMAQAA